MSSYISLPTFAANHGARLHLTGGVCRACSTIAYPPRNHCLICNATAFDPVSLSGEGEIYSFTVIASGGAPAEFDQQQTLTGAIAVAVVELVEGPRVIGQVVTDAPFDLEIGRKVRGEVRRLYDQEGVVRYGLKFVAEGQEAAA
jgi:uncharacterized OB-fold protein